MKSDFDRDYSMSQRHIPAALEILGCQEAKHFIDFRIGNRLEDTKFAADLVFFDPVGKARIGLRVRAREYWDRYADVTIRALRDSGMKTELQKLREGLGDLYFYGWSVGDGRRDLPEFYAWLMLSTQKLRESGLLDEKRRLISNRDGSHFISLSLPKLIDADCLISMCPRVEERFMTSRTFLWP